MLAISRKRTPVNHISILHRNQKHFSVDGADERLMNSNHSERAFWDNDDVAEKNQKKRTNYREENANDARLKSTCSAEVGAASHPHHVVRLKLLEIV